LRILAREAGRMGAKLMDGERWTMTRRIYMGTVGILSRTYAMTPSRTCSSR